MIIRPRIALCVAAGTLFVAQLPAYGQGILHSTYGTSPGDDYGWSMGGAGDVDADGYDDVIVGSAAWGVISGKGLVRVVSGKTGAALHNLAGTTTNDIFGYSVDGVGDLNADGHADFVVGIRPWDYSNGGPGSAKVYSGATGAVLFTFTGTQNSNGFGGAVAGAGDVNKDGVPDVVVGSPNEPTGGVDAGGVWVFSGKTGAMLRHFVGGADDQLGISVDGAGDVDGDGYADVVAGSNTDGVNGDYSGNVKVFSGKTGALLFTKLGTAGSQSGVSVAGLGDVDGDGKSDVAFGAISDSTGGQWAGKVVVCRGFDGAVLRTFLGVAGDGLGYDVAGPGDVDGDGRADVLMSAPYHLVGAEKLGMVRIHSAVTGALLESVVGTSDAGEFGYSAVAAGDVNADGRPDFAVGAYSDDSAASNAGAAYIYSTECGATSSYGSGCAGFGGFVPALALGGCATPGGTMSLALTKGNGNKPVLLFIGANQTNLPIQGGCTLLTFPILTVINATLSAGGAGAGALNALGVLPMNAPLGTIRMQAFILDNQVIRGYSSSNGVSASIE